MMNVITATMIRAHHPPPRGCLAAVGNVANKSFFSTTTTTTTTTSIFTSSLSPQKQKHQQHQSICMLNNNNSSSSNNNNSSSSNSNSSNRSIISESESVLQNQKFASAMPLSSSMLNIRYFSSTTTSGGDGSKKEATPPVVPVPVVDFDADDNSNSTTSLKGEYDPYEIIKSFKDTSYYYPPSEELNPDYLAAKYQNLTNDELLDSSTITLQDSPDSTWNELIHSPPIRDKNSSLPNGTLIGTVVSTKMNKTINVAVDRFRTHTKYKKRMKYTRKFMAHDESEVASMGDTVLIVPSQRISKLKHFMLREILKPKGQL